MWFTYSRILFHTLRTHLLAVIDYILVANKINLLKDLQSSLSTKVTTIHPICPFKFLEPKINFLSCIDTFYCCALGHAI
jgi:hypothetical protein